MPGSNEDPILDVVAGVIGRLKEREEQPEAVLTCNDLLGIVGAHSHALALFIFSLLNLLPAPPGYNLIMSLIILAISIRMLRGRPIQIAGALGRTKLPVKLVMKMLSLLSKLAGWIARVSAPRLRPLTGPVAARAVAVGAIVFATAMLPPIPAGNMVPSIGLLLMCIGLLNHDGVMVIAGFLVGLAGLALLGIAIWLIFVIGFAVEDALDGDPDVMPTKPTGAG